MNEPQPPSAPPNPPYPPYPPFPPSGPGGPPRYAYPPPPPPARGNPLLGCGFAVSLVLNVLAIVVIVLLCMGYSMLSMGAAGLADSSGNLLVPESRVMGKASAKSKVAVISIEGAIVEGLLGFVHREIDQAARDKDVKAVVVRINSPGGSVTASEDLHHRLLLLRDGDPEKKTDPKLLVASMGSIAASGGYYVAMPASTVFAERSTLTGSIGVYVSFPTVVGLAEKYGFGMNLIKQGEIKDSGSAFKELSTKEKQVWQDLVDTSYDQFLDVVAQGRLKKLTRQDLIAPVTVKPINAGPPKPDKERAGPYQRYRADGGVWTAEKALELQLVDHLGPLEDAIKAAHDAANLGEDYKAIRYERPRTVLDTLLGNKAVQPGSLLEAGRLRAALMPRMWYLASGFDLAGFLAAAEAE